VSAATIVLGRDGMGALADEADFDAWVAYVSDRIDDATGLDVTVEVRRARDVQDDAITGTDDRQPIHDTIQSLWDDFCSDDSAWPSRAASTEARS
jgi:hypothetical protein